MNFTREFRQNNYETYVVGLFTLVDACDCELEGDWLDEDPCWLPLLPPPNIKEYKKFQRKRNGYNTRETIPPDCGDDEDACLVVPPLLYNRKTNTL